MLLASYLVVAVVADLPPFQDRPQYWRALIERERLWLDYGDSPNPSYSCFDMDMQVMWIKFVDDGWSAEVAWTDADDKPRRMKLPFIDKQVFGTEVYASGLYRLTLEPEVRFASPARNIGPC
jgi:hypothetical protein